MTKSSPLKQFPWQFALSALGGLFAAKKASKMYKKQQKSIKCNKNQ